MTSTQPDETSTARANPAGPRGAHSTLTAAVGSLPSWLVVGYGVLTAALGVAMLAWPHKTLLVLVALFAAQLFLSGAFQLVRAVTPWASGAAERVLLAIGGALALLAGLLILRRPLQTLVIVTLLVGAWWIIKGVMDLVVGAMLGDTGSRLGSLFLGALSLAAGIYVLLNPGISLLAFVWVSGVWTVVAGVAIVVTSLTLRRRSA